MVIHYTNIFRIDKAAELPVVFTRRNEPYFSR